MKVDVKHNTSRESTYHFRNNQHTTRDIQIEAIDHTDIRTNRQEKCQQYLPHQIHLTQITNPPTNLTRS